MRDIRFRAWDKEEKEFVSSDAVGFLMNEKGNLTGWHWPYEHKGGVEVVLMQFTGLKDRTGRDIYEGDILGVPNPTMKYVVRFGEFENNKTYGEYECGTGFYLEDKEDRGGLYEGSSYKVIGNIHKNKELLNA